MQRHWDTSVFEGQYNYLTIGRRCGTFSRPNESGEICRHDWLFGHRYHSPSMSRRLLLTMLIATVNGCLDWGTRSLGCTGVFRKSRLSSIFGSICPCESIAPLDSISPSPPATDQMVPPNTCVGQRIVCLDIADLRMKDASVWIIGCPVLP